MIRFIDEHKDDRSGSLRWGIESIATRLGIAPVDVSRRQETATLEASDPRSRVAVADLAGVEENLAVYGADKIWDQLNKDENDSMPD